MWVSERLRSLAIKIKNKNRINPLPRDGLGRTYLVHRVAPGPVLGHHVQEEHLHVPVHERRRVGVQVEVERQLVHDLLRHNQLGLVAAGG